MKKGLSVLLIAAALFGFYGGAVNLNDVLACKDYWEKEDERTTADLNKLEDGLNQLKDNEEAYLDGLEQVKDGEEALAKGEADLAKGEADYAAGQKELAKGEADYAAAPGKLADARKKLAAGEKKIEDGEKDLADGQDSIDGLTKLIKGIGTILSGYKGTWRPGYEKLKDGRSQLYKGSKGSKDDLTALAVFLPDASKKGYVAAVGDVAGDDEKQTSADYKEFISSTNEMANDLPVIQKNVEALTKEALRLYKKLSAIDNNADFAQAVAAESKALLQFEPLIPSNLKSTYVNGINDTVKKVAAMPGMIESLVKQKMLSEETGNAIVAKVTTEMGKAETQQKIQALIAGGMSEAEAKKTVQDKVTEEVTAKVLKTVTDEVTAGVIAQTNADPENTANRKQLVQAVGMLYNGTTGVTGLKDVNESVNGDSSKIKNVLLPGLVTFNKAATSKAIDDLAAGQDTIAGGVSTVASAVLGNKTLKEGVKKNMGNKAVTLLKAYRSKTNPLSSKMSDFAAFETQMDSTPGLVASLTKAKSLLAKTKANGLKTLADGKKTLAAGKKTLAAGKKEYAKGLADYKAAPGKLADGRAKLAEGLKKLMDGRQKLADGRVDLANGKEKLAEYEDGEQQVRDGLATLMASEANGGLESILERRNGDDEFDDANGHLDLAEGLDAVGTGREYKKDSGVLVTNEITARAIGTGAGLGAAVLAVLAALLGLLKKNKGAGVLACLTAAAGAAGTAYGMNAGTEFSEIAGSHVGTTPWIAFGILAAVAVVDAVVHFTAKKEA